MTSDIYKTENLSKDNEKKFFNTGEHYIKHIFANIAKHIDFEFIPERTLDFGCGVGRLVIPLSKRSKHVLGVDISQSMLNEAEINCNSRDIQNVHFMKSDHTISNLTGKFDLIHSFIVFQHIPSKYGEKIFETLLEHMADEGVGVFHFTYSVPSSKKLICMIKNKFPITHNISNLIMRRPFSTPRMQMNNYNLNKLLYLIQQHNINELYSEFTDHNGALGITVYFKK